jgi:hypothetical protein
MLPLYIKYEASKSYSERKSLAVQNSREKVDSAENSLFSYQD